MVADAADFVEHVDASAELVEVPEYSGDERLTLRVGDTGSYVTVVGETAGELRDEPAESFALERAGDGQYRAVTSAVEVVVVDDPTGGPVRVRALGSESEVGLRFPAARSVSGRLEGATVVYPDALPETDLEVAVRQDGAKINAWLRSELAPHEFEVVIDAAGGTPVVDDSGHVRFVDTEGSPDGGSLWIPHGWMVDSSVHPTTGRPAYSDGVSYRIAERSGETVLVVSADEEWLADPERVYPVMVDPALALTLDVADTYVTDGDSADHSAEPSLWVGHDDATGKASRAYVKLAPGLWDVGGDEQVADDWASFLAGKNVLGGWYAHRLAGCPAGPPADLSLHPTFGSWDAQGLTWANQPFTGSAVGSIDDVVAPALSTVLDLGDCHSNPADEGSEVVAWWLGSSLASPWMLGSGLMIGAEDESSGTLTELRATQGYDFAGALVVWWSDGAAVDAPLPPAEVAPSTVVGSLQPTLSAVYETDAMEVRRGAILFVIEDTAGTLVGVHATPPVWPGLRAEAAVGPGVLEWNREYVVRSYAVTRTDDEPGWEPLFADLFDESTNASLPTTTSFSTSPYSIDGIDDGDLLFGEEELVVGVHDGSVPTSVTVTVDGDPYATTTALPHAVVLDTTGLDDGPIALGLVVTDAENEVVAGPTIQVVVDNAMPPIDRVVLDRERGRLLVDDYALLLLQAAFGVVELDARYVPSSAGASDSTDSYFASSATPLVSAMFSYDFDDLQPATQIAIEDLIEEPNYALDGHEAPGGGGGEPPDGTSGTPDPECLDPLQVRSQNSTFRRCEIVHEFDDPGLPAVSITFSLGDEELYEYDPEPGDPPLLDLDENDLTGVDPKPSVAFPTYPQQIYEYLMVIEASMLTFRDAGYGDPSDLPSPLPVRIEPIATRGLACCSYYRLGPLTRGGPAWIKLHPSAEGPTVIHEMFHLFQFELMGTNKDSDGDTYKWFLESTTRYAEAYYASIDGTPLNEVMSHVVPAAEPPTHVHEGVWAKPPESLRIGAALWQHPARALTARGPESRPHQDRPWGAGRWYAGGIFWQYLAERLNDDNDIDVVYEFWQAVADHSGSVDYFDDILRPLVADQGPGLESLVADLWVAMHTMHHSNSGSARYSWTLPSSDPNAWHSRLAPPALRPSGLFGMQRLMAPSDLSSRPRQPVDPGYEREILELQSGVQGGASGEIEPGGAWVVDVDPADGVDGDLTVSLFSSDDTLRATLVGYGIGGHPYICSSASGEVVDRRTGAGVLTISVVDGCSAASLVVVHPDPHASGQPISFSARINHLWEGSDLVWLFADGASSGSLPSSTWLHVYGGQNQTWDNYFSGGYATLRPIITTGSPSAIPGATVTVRITFYGHRPNSTTVVGEYTLPAWSTVEIDDLGSLHNNYSRVLPATARLEVLDGEVTSWEASAVLEVASS
ncbi:MAG: hypothetical protein JJU45_07465 [Acidimicrobiia bacterium]|nr:hypothetical protein [Acidimicrobiia bacterium]